MSLKSLIQTVAEALVDHPESVSVTEVDGEKSSVLELRVAEGDIGKVIGREGRTAQAIRMLLAAASAKHGRRVHLDIVD